MLKLKPIGRVANIEHCDILRLVYSRITIHDEYFAAVSDPFSRPFFYCLA